MDLDLFSDFSLNLTAMTFHWGIGKIIPRYKIPSNFKLERADMKRLKAHAARVGVMSRSL